jgi:C_GCAxxG_C_C family probable redox protein
MPSEDEAVRHASECWDKGFNCAESALRGICYGMGIDMPESALKMATPFGGGIGRCEDVCGALSGGVMGIGAGLGRNDPKADKTVCYGAAKKLHEQFTKEFGSSSCRALNLSDFDSPEHEARCKAFTLASVRMSYRILNMA